MTHPANSRSVISNTVRPNPVKVRLLMKLLLAALVLISLPGCASDEEQEDPKPRKPKRVRDPVENKVFYQGWWPESW